MKTLLLPDALEAAGVNVRLMVGWDSPAKAGYVWREADGDPAGHMHHHTATASYVPNRDKANGYAGIARPVTLRLFQEDYEDGFPQYVIANAYPAPISSGKGDFGVLEKVRAGVEVDGRQGPDSTVGSSWWYGNTHYWNTEWVLNGVGAPIEPEVWDMMTRVCFTQNVVMGWTRAMHIGHGHHTRRKIDLYGGQFQDFDDTVNHLRDAMEADLTYRGVLNVPDKKWARDVVDWGILTGVIVVTDSHADDWANDDYTDGRLWTMLSRFDKYLKST